MNKRPLSTVPVGSRVLFRGATYRVVGRGQFLCELEHVSTGTRCFTGLETIVSLIF